LAECFKSNKKGKYTDLHFKIYEKGTFNINLKVKRPVASLVEGINERKWANLIVLMLWLNPRSASNMLENMIGLFGK
jgi:hypothetical protein